LIVSGDSLLDAFVDVLSMANGEDSDLCCQHLDNDAIVADAKFPVPLERLTKGISKLLRSLCKAGLDRICDAASEVAWN
jgi:hypothetical protein